MSAEAASLPQDRAAEHRRILVERLVTKTKASLLTRDPVAAFRNFQTAHRLDPQHPEANFYLALSRLLSWPVRHYTDVRSLGFRGPSRRSVRTTDLNPLRFMVMLPHALRLPAQLSNGTEVQARIARDPQQELHASLAELARIPDSFVSSVPMRNPFTGSPAIDIDGADVALIRAAAHVTLATCYLSQVYDVDAEIQPIAARAHEPNKHAIAAEILSAHPRLLRLRDAQQARWAKDELLAAIDDYLHADTLLRAETDDQQDDLFSFSPLPEDVRKQDAFRQAVVDLRNSLTGLSDSAWALTIDQLLHLGDVFDRPIDLRALETGPGIQEMLLSHLVYQSERALANLHTAPVTFSQRIDSLNPGVPLERALEIDYGDLLALQAGLESFNAAAAILASYNAELSLPQTAVLAGQEDVDLDDAILNPHPDLLQVGNRNRLREGRILGIQALQTALDALAYARSSDDADHTDDAIPVDRFEQAEAHLRPPLESLRQSLQAHVDPDPEAAGDEFLVNLAPVFDGLNPRQVLPQFDGVKPLPAPDPTFGGVLLDGMPHSGEP